MDLDPLAPIRFGFRIGLAVLSFEKRLLERALGLGRREAPTVVSEADAHETEADAPPAPAPSAVRFAPQADVPPPTAEAEPPAHIDTEPELVAEFAEKGAEEAPGPEIHVEEPWAGYRRMRVADIRDRVAAAGPEELAVVELFEATHRKRRSVLDAVERRSRQLANAPKVH